MTPCETHEIKDEKGDVVGAAIVCRRGSYRPKCSVPGCHRTSTKLCDFPLAGKKAGKTCDRPLCNVHAKAVSKNVDYCPPHHEHAKNETALPAANVDAPKGGSVV